MGARGTLKVSLYGVKWFRHFVHGISQHVSFWTKNTHIKVGNSELKGVFSKPSGDYIVVPNFCFFEVETSNFGSSYVFSSLLKTEDRILPNLTFWTQKWHISGNMQVPLCQKIGFLS